DEYVAVLLLELELVHRSRSRPSLHLAVQVEARVVAGALELGHVRFEVHGAPEVRAHGAVRTELVPFTQHPRGADLDLHDAIPRVALVGEEVHLHWVARLEARRL